MAKRPKSRKAVRKSARATRPRRAAGRMSAAAGGGGGPRGSLPLKQLRQELDLAVAKLSRRVEVTGQPSAKVSRAIAVFTRWASEIDDLCDRGTGDFCGPTMDPLS